MPVSLRLRSRLASLLRRLRRDGAGNTVRWLGGHVAPCLTGVPLRRYSQVTPELWVGAQIGRVGKRRLGRLGIAASVNLRAEFDDSARGLALPRHLWLPTVDGEAPSTEHLRQGVEFIADVLASGGKVYLHCQSGIGRAPTLAAAFLVAQGAELDLALRHLHSVRPFIDLTSPQIERLHAFREDL